MYAAHCNNTDFRIALVIRYVPIYFDPIPLTGYHSYYHITIRYIALFLSSKQRPLSVYAVLLFYRKLKTNNR